MRMWNVNPEWMCNQHLLGEHLEMHMFVGAIRKGKSVQGYADKGLVDTTLIQLRHDELVKEMTRRGFKHKSPLSYNDMLNIGLVDVHVSERGLIHRCKDCRRRHNELSTGC